MKPKTKLHFEILELKKKLPKVTSAQISWGYKNVFKYWGYKTKHTAVCFECGHKWKMETNLISKLFPTKCPSCEREIEFSDSRSWSRTDKGYWHIKTVAGRFQVIRMFHAIKYSRKGYDATVIWDEVYQQWISSDGKVTILAIRSNTMLEYRTGTHHWAMGSIMEIRNDHDKYYINDAPEYPRRKILPEIIRNGWCLEYYGFNHGWFFHMLLMYPKFETLLKAGQYNLLENFGETGEKIEKYWSQIKICIKHNYRVKDAKIWFDNFTYLDYFHLDKFSPNNLCPKNLQAFHQELIDRHQVREDKKELESLMAEINEAEKKYKIDKAKYLGIKFSNGEIDVLVLPSVYDFYLEGKALHHCVFRNKYYDSKEHPGTLIFSARKGEERLETIEVSITKKKVMQIHGKNHTESKYRKDILKILESNIDSIGKVKARRKRKLVA